MPHTVSPDVIFLTQHGCVWIGLERLYRLGTTHSLFDIFLVSFAFIYTFFLALSDRTAALMSSLLAASTSFLYLHRTGERAGGSFDTTAAVAPGNLTWGWGDGWERGRPAAVGAAPGTALASAPPTQRRPNPRVGSTEPVWEGNPASRGDRLGVGFWI
jgi:hypothetical protein